MSSVYNHTRFISRRGAELFHEPLAPESRILVSISTPSVKWKTMNEWEEMEAASTEVDSPAALHLPSWHDVLRLEFHDAEPSATTKFRIYFSEEQAEQVISFLKKHESSSVKEVLVHCDAGISRSAAISKFAAMTYGLPFNENYRLYNKHVFSTLLKVAGRIPRNAEESAFSSLPKDQP